MFAAKTNAQLCGLSAGGSAEAFTELVRRTQGAVCAVTYAATGRRDISEDVAQETYLVAWKKLRQQELDEPEKVAGWLVGIGRNLARKTTRERTSESLDRAEGLVSDDKTIEDIAAEQQQRDRVWALLSELPERYREVMILFYREEQSTPRVGELLGISVSAAEQRLSRGRKMLRAKVERALGEELLRTRPTAAFTDRVAAALPLGALAPPTAPTSSLPLTTFAKAISMKTLSLTAAAIVTTLAVGYVALDRREDSTIAAATVAPARTAATPTTPRSNAPTESSAVFGLVVDAGAGRPIEGAVVTIIGPTRAVVLMPSHGDSPQPAVVRSDDEGGWMLRGLPPGRYSAVATAPGRLPSAPAPFEVSAGQDVRGLKVELAAGGVSLSGVVSDVGGGPIAGATVRAKGAAGFPASAITDDDGRYALHLPHGGYELSVWDPQYQDDRKRVSVEGAGAKVDFALVPAATIAGRVVERGSGAPVAGAVISYEKLVQFGGGFSSDRSDEEGNAVTDENGRFSLQRLAPAEYALFANVDHFATRAPARVELGIADQVEDVVVTVDPAFNATGTVFVEGDPSAGIAGVTVSTISDGAPVRAVTGPDGSFTLAGMLPGTYPLMVESDAAIPSMLEVSITIRDADQDGVEIPLEPGTEISGRIEPPGIAQVRLAMRGSTGGIEVLLQSVKVQHAKVTTAADGSFTLAGAPRGSWKLVAEAVDGSAGELEIEVGEGPTRDIRLEMAPRPAVRGRVVDVEGRPLGQVSVRLQDDLGDAKGAGSKFRAQVGAKTTTTDEDGAFALVGLTSGRYLLSVEDHRGVAFPREGTTMDDAGLPVTVDDTPLDGVELRVQRPSGMIEGRVLNAEGAAHVDAWVSLSPNDGEIPLDRSLVAVTDREGHFAFESLAEGTYDIDVRSNRGDATVERDDVATGEALELTLAPLGTIRGVVTAGGSPVKAFTVEGAVTSRAFYAEDGRFELRHLQPGHPLITVTAAEGGVGKRLAVTGGEVAEATFDVGAWATVEGRAVDEDGNPVAGLVLSASSAGGVREDRTPFAAAFSGEDQVVTGPDGHFSLDGVGAGRGELTFSDAAWSAGHELDRGGALFYVEPGERVKVGDVRVLGTEVVGRDARGTLAMSVRAGFDAPTAEDTLEPTGAPSEDPKLFVARLSNDGPAADAQLTPGMRILAIDGESVETLGASLAARLLKSERLEAGQVVRLEIADAKGGSRTVELRAAPN